MERDIDLSPRQIFDWLRYEAARGAARGLDWRASREFQAETANFANAGIDPEDELTAMVTVGLLEVEPRGPGPRWTLRLRVEDEVGSHLPEDGSVPDEPETLDLETFEAAFFLDVGTSLPAEIALDADTPEARRHFERSVARHR